MPKIKSSKKKNPWDLNEICEHNLWVKKKKNNDHKSVRCDIFQEPKEFYIFF